MKRNDFTIEINSVNTTTVSVQTAKKHEIGVLWFFDDTTTGSATCGALLRIDEKNVASVLLSRALSSDGPFVRVCPSNPPHRRGRDKVDRTMYIATLLQLDATICSLAGHNSVSHQTIEVVTTFCPRGNLGCRAALIFFS